MLPSLIKSECLSVHTLHGSATDGNGRKLMPFNRSERRMISTCINANVCIMDTIEYFVSANKLAIQFYIYGRLNKRLVAEFSSCMQYACRVSAIFPKKKKTKFCDKRN